MSCRNWWLNSPWMLLEGKPIFKLDPKLPCVFALVWLPSFFVLLFAIRFAIPDKCHRVWSTSVSLLGVYLFGCFRNRI
jgi:hypothetical protein